MPAYRDETTNTWYTKFYYVDWTGTRKQKFKRGFSTKREAAAWERDFLDKQTASPNMTFKSLKELYFEDMATRLRENTIKSKKAVVDTKILPYFENLNIDEIKSPAIRKWQGEILSQGFSQSYVRYVHTQLSSIFNYAVTHYNLSENPCKRAGTIGSTKTKEIEFWTIDEYNEFIPRVNPKYVMAFKVLYWSGLRVGELMALTPKDIVLENRIINVDKSYQKIKKKDVITAPKTPGSIRKVTIPDTLCIELKEYMAGFYDLSDTDRIFIFSKQMLNKEITKVCNEMDLKRITVHDIRHSHVSLLIELGFPPLLIAERVGHDKVETTLNTYGHLYPNKHSEVADKLETLIK